MSPSRSFFMVALLVISTSALVVYVFGYVYLAKKITREKYENATWPDVGLQSSRSSRSERPMPPSAVIDRMEKDVDDMKQIKRMLISETEAQLAEQTQTGIENTKQELVESTRKGVQEDTKSIIQGRVQNELRNLQSIKDGLRSGSDTRSPQLSGRVTLDVDRVYAPFDAYHSGLEEGGRMVVISRDHPDPTAFSGKFSSRLRDHFSSSRDAWRNTPFGYYVFMNNDAAMTYRVQVPRDGTYYIDAFVYARQGNTDSFYMEIDGGGRQWWNLPYKFGFVSWRKMGLNKGQHIITVRGREPTGFAALRIRSENTDASDLPKSSGLSQRVKMEPGKAVPPLATYNRGLVEHGGYLVIDEENPDPTRFTRSFDDRLRAYASSKEAWRETPFGYYVFLSTDSAFMYVFDAPVDGEYDIELSVIVEGGKTDSFYMEVDGGGRQTWHLRGWESSRAGYLRWRRQRWSRGEHTLTVHGREPTGLAAVRISAV